MFNNHTMTMVHDLNMVAGAIRNIDFITVAAITTSTYPDLPNVYDASILIPETEILMEWADGNQLILQNEYPKYLMSKDCDDMIVALIAALTQKNIILYIPKEEFDVYGMMLMNHIYYVYGITMNYMNTVFSVNPAKLPFIMAKFFIMGIMEANDFINAYPANYPLPEFVINKLAEELRPFQYPATFEQYADYFNKLNASKEQQRQMVNMVRLVDKNDSIHT